MRTNNLKLLTLLTLFLIASCGEKAKQSDKNEETMTEEMAKAPVYNTDDPQSMLAAIEYAHGGWGDLWNKADVQYTYTYNNPVAEKTDISTERYIFKNEASYGHYTKHEINVMPDVEGEVTQFFNGDSTTVMVEGEPTEDPQANAVGDFLRKANYFWFVMPYKLNDTGTITAYEGQEDYKGTTYDKLKVTYDPDITGKEQNDSYILYVNPETKMIDRFFFSLPFLGVNEPALIAEYDYEDVDGQKLATKRAYFMPNDKGEYPTEPSLVQTLTDITFNNGFSVENMMKASK